MFENAAQKSGYITLAAILITLGVFGFMGMNMLWPVVFILLPGLVLLWLALAGGAVAAVIFAVPGMLIAGTGALMFLQNLTGYWESWAYAWTLYGPFLGLAFALMGRRIGEPALVAVGRWFVYAGVVAFAVFGVFFELLAFRSSGALLPMLLIAVGLYLLVQNTASGCLLAQSEDLRAVEKPKRKRKREDRLFTGPVVYGSCVRKHGDARVAVVDVDDSPEQPR